MLTQLSKVIISFILSIIAIYMYLRFKGTERKWCMFAMLSSTLGDIFMTDIIGIGDVSTYPGAAFFIIAHCIYAICFIRASKRKGYKLLNKGMIAGIAITAIVALLLAITMFAVTHKMQGMFLPLIAYLLFIGWNLSCEFSYAYSEGGQRRFLYLGMLLFIISDFLVFLPMLNVCEGTPSFNDIIWFTYIPAQLLIILFNSDILDSKEV